MCYMNIPIQHPKYIEGPHICLDVCASLCVLVSHLALMCADGC